MDTIDNTISNNNIDTNEKLFIKIKRKKHTNSIIAETNIIEQINTSKMSKLELLEKCKEFGIIKYSSKNKSQLIKLINSKQHILKNDLKIKTNTIISCNNEVNIITYKPTFIEVCSGCGGLSSGFIEAGFTPLLLNEINATFCKTLKKNHPGVPVENRDMLELHLNTYKGKVDILMGGVPCQAFSQSGERKGLEDPRGHLIVEFNLVLNIFHNTCRYICLLYTKFGYFCHISC